MTTKTIDNLEGLLYRSMRLAKVAIESLDNKMMRETLQEIYTEIDGKINAMEEQEDR
jgi:hypothetical protein